MVTICPAVISCRSEIQLNRHASNSYLQFDVGRALKIPGFRDQLTERILSEPEVLRIISLEPNPRNRAILLTLYAGGFRVSEICSLKWRHLQERDESGQITVFGKGDKTRTVLMPKSVW